MVKHRAPVYIQSLLEGHLHGEGLGLHELAIFAATLADLVNSEAAGDLRAVFKTLDMPTVGSVSQEHFEYAVKAYLLSLFTSHFPSHKRGYKFLERRIDKFYPAWGETYAWVQDLQQSQDIVQRSRRNPFVEQQHTFDQAVSLVHEIKHRFGPFQNIECHVLKERLLDMEDGGSGRVRLSRFYRDAIHGDFTFMESVDYLRSLGALDETDSQRPSVIIPNYINSPANCISSSGFYDVCCSDGCEDLMRHLEWYIASPSAVPERIVDIVSALSSDTVVAPRNLSTTLMTRLSEIATFHGGHVPLHGRLFSQWMHHAFPRECPFPHVSGTTKPMIQEEYVKTHGVESPDATKEEIYRYTSAHEDELVMTPLPWTLEEELVAERGHLAEPCECFASLRVLVAFAALASFAVPMVRASIASPQEKCEKCMV
jgi:diadenosine tetraphosphatase ApaH/serine/threonine PP2A family protein phosphatase